MKGNKQLPNWREEVKLSLFEGDMLLHVENIGLLQKNLLKLRNEFSEVAGCKLNIQKPVAFPYTMTNYQKEN